jgi:anti-anti-sigma factor
MVALPVSRPSTRPWGSVTCCAVPDPLRVTLCGEIDIALEENLDAVAAFLENSARSDLAVCLHDVTFLDSTGLDFLVRLRGRTQDLGRRFRIVAPSTAACWVLRIAGLLELFEVEDPADGPCGCTEPRIDGVHVLSPTQRRSDASD